MSPRRWFLAGLIGLLALPAGALAEPSLRLISPTEGQRLAPGAFARIEWEDHGLLDGYETEWEAFLSLDGGQTYPIRLTPHLDLALSGFSFEVPNLPSRDARLLLRFGDERVERSIETPVRFEIGAGGNSTWVADLLTGPFAQTFESGESARRGDRGVVLWLEGDREGRGLRSRARIPSRRALTEARLGAGRLLFASGPESARVRLVPPSATAIDRPIAVPAAPLADDLWVPVSLRLRIHRFNE